jgi:Bacterial protein of unknown function (DUF839)
MVHAQPTMPSKRLRLVTIVAIGLLMAGVVPVTAVDGFKTDQDPMIAPLVAGVDVDPIITVGETVGRYRFEAIPDGISIRSSSAGTEIWVNHETARVPFPYNLPPSPANQNDFDNAQLSHLWLDPATASVLSGQLVIRSTENFQRFCSNYLATSKEGFDRPLLFTNEETPDWTNRTGSAWPATIGAPEAREGGFVVAVDPPTGEHRTISGMGRFNHENSVAIPGYDKVVLLSGDDTFTTSPSQSQLYSYIAKNADGVWNDDGRLYAFVSDDPVLKRYDDFAPGETRSVTGKFIPVPKLIARGMNPDGTELEAEDVPPELGGPYPEPPKDGSWQRPPGTPSSATDVPGIDGPQWVLEYWSKLNNVFAFTRVEDIAHDKRPGQGNVVYIADSGRATAGAPQIGRSTNGRIWKMVLDPKNERKVTSLSILIEGDDHAVKTRDEIHQPDNVETTANALYITEDPSGNNQFPVDSADPNKTAARLWQYRFADGLLQPIAVVDHAADEGPTDVDPSTTRGQLGAWESSGVLDASAAFGPGALLIDVQAHTLWVEKADGPDLDESGQPDWTDKREGGQLLLIRVTGG